MRERVIALGFFDGVHLGHGALLRRAAEEAKKRGCESAVFTFDRPPKEVITGIPCPLINSPEDRAELVRRLYGIDEMIMVPFDDEMRTLGPLRDGYFGGALRRRPPGGGPRPPLRA